VVICDRYPETINQVVIATVCFDLTSYLTKRFFSSRFLKEKKADIEALETLFDET
jgi:hypothetical protein